MARPKSGKAKKEKINLSLAPEVKEMVEVIRQEMGVSISELVEEHIRKVYEGLKKD